MEKNDIFFDFRLRLPEGIAKLNFELLPAWLTSLNSDFKIHFPSNNRKIDRDLAIYWLQFSLELYLFLNKSLDIPVFKRPNIKSINQVGDSLLEWDVSICFYDVNLIPKEKNLEILIIAFKWANWIERKNAPAANYLSYIYHQIHKELEKILIDFKFPSKSLFELLQSAYRMNIPYANLHAGVYQLGWGINSKIIDRSTTERDSAMGMRWSHNKFWSAGILRNAGLPASDHHLVNSLASAKSRAQLIGFPVVIKPVDMERGEGITVDVLEDSLEPAFETAYKISPSKQVLVERQVTGVCHRLLIAQGQLLYAVKRLPIGVYGNDQSTITELIQLQNAKQETLPPWKRSKILRLDELALISLKHQNLDSETIPGAGEFVALRRIESSAWGGVDEEITHTLHPENLRIALLASKLFNLDVAGVDIISSDLTQPWYENGAIINEVNYSPLLGGGDISRSHLDRYLSQLIPNQGRIPIVVFLGGDGAMRAGQKFLEDKNSNGHGMVLTSADLTLGTNGQELHMPLHGLNARVNALLMQKDTQALVVVIQTNEIILNPFCVDKIDELYEIDNHISDVKSFELIAEENFKLMKVILKKLLH